MYNKNSDEASQRSVPISIARSFPDEHTVEYEIAKTQFNSTFFLCDRKQLSRPMLLLLLLLL
jgi:hypothetical protein